MEISTSSGAADYSKLYINGEWCDSSGEETIPVSNPATLETVTDVPSATPEDVDRAYEAASAAQPEWETMPREERDELLEDALEELSARSEEIVELLIEETGSTTDKAWGEYGISKVDFRTALALDPPEEETRDSPFFDGKESRITYEPVGVAGIISPWNYPLHLTTRALAPALALGNTVVVKPATETPLSGGLLLAKIADAVGFPDGVVNVVTGRGSEIGDRVAGHAIPRVLFFTGSTDVGTQVASRAGEQITKPSLELGGNAPNVVTEDVDVEQAAKIGAVGSFTHQGQVCISINRHLVHEDVYEEYVDRIVAHAESLTIGDPSDPDVDIGPVINETQRDDLLGFVEKTIDEGATLETGGTAGDLYFEPTVLSNVSNEMAAACNEHFGPIAPVIPFDSDEEAIELANDTRYGLSAAVQCRNLDRAQSLANRITAGMVHINDHPIQDEPNAPYGGLKQSGLGRFNGEWVAAELVEPRWISTQHEQREYNML